MSRMDMSFTEKQIFYLWEMLHREIDKVISGSSKKDIKILSAIGGKLSYPYNYYCNRIKRENRDEEIYSVYQKGGGVITYQDLAKEYKLSPQRVMQICFRQAKKGEKRCRLMMRESVIKLQQK